MEWRKYKIEPIQPDIIEDYKAAQAWGYVIAGYSLIEQSLKAILYMRDICPERTHTLIDLFNEIKVDDQEIIRNHYLDFYYSFPGMNSFPYLTIDDFFSNLDGARNDKKKKVGSFDWRYFPTQEESGSQLPLVSINMMHEIVYGCLDLIKSIHYENKIAGRYTYSWRLYYARSRLRRYWCELLLNSPKYEYEGDRLEILWGPTYDDRYDFLVFKNKQTHPFFASLPNKEENRLPVINKQGDFALFDPVEEFRRIGTTIDSSETLRQPESSHIMF